MKYSSSQSSRFWYDLKCNVENLKWSSSISVLIGSQMALAAQTLLSQASRVLVSSFSQRLIFLLINTSRFKKKIFLQLFGWHSLNKLSFNCMLNGIKPAIFWYFAKEITLPPRPRRSPRTSRPRNCPRLRQTQLLVEDKELRQTERPKQKVELK